jgi:hypothetical protein
VLDVFIGAERGFGTVAKVYESPGIPAKYIAPKPAQVTKRVWPSELSRAAYLETWRTSSCSTPRTVTPDCQIDVKQRRPRYGSGFGYTHRSIAESLRPSLARISHGEGSLGQLSRRGFTLCPIDTSY